MTLRWDWGGFLENIGAFRERLTVLGLVESEGSVVWEAGGRIWGKAERARVPSLFSTHGLSAEGWTFWVRKYPLTLSHAILFNGFTHFITAIEDLGSGFLKLSTAKVPFVTCWRMDEAGNAWSRFPGVLTEKYAKFVQENPMAQNLRLHVLITPKVVDLDEGDMVEVDGHAYGVQVGHRMDGAKNEFEVWKRDDL